MRTVKWVDASSADQSGGEGAATGGDLKPTTAEQARKPTKRKVVETEPEPAHTIIDASAKELELLVSATADFSKYKCKVEDIVFKDTLMFQTRKFK